MYRIASEVFRECKKTNCNLFKINSKVEFHFYEFHDNDAVLIG